jgi:hypothetical protein
MDDSDGKKAPPKFLVRDSSCEMAARPEGIDMGEIRDHLNRGVVERPVSAVIRKLATEITMLPHIEVFEADDPPTAVSDWLEARAAEMESTRDAILENREPSAEEREQARSELLREGKTADYEPMVLERVSCNRLRAWVATMDISTKLAKHDLVECERVIDLLKLALGIRTEWSTNYGYAEFLGEAQAVIGFRGLAKTQVLCDDCGGDFTFRDDVGGILFVSRALCPSCAVRWEAGAEKDGELEFIRARCPEGKSFADWVRQDLRKEDRQPTVTERFAALLPEHVIATIELLCQANGKTVLDVCEIALQMNGWLYSRILQLRKAPQRYLLTSRYGVLEELHLTEERHIGGETLEALTRLGQAVLLVCEWRSTEGA